MCGIAGMIELGHQPIQNIERRLEVMNTIQAHRGPDGKGTWTHVHGHVGLAHCRLAVIDLTTGSQPMRDGGNWICYNGEIYNYMELREELGGEYKTTSDTEVILRAWRKWGERCVEHFTGMFAFALWDEESGTLFCARDRFGVKPFYYTVQAGVFYFASEMKTLLPFVPEVETDLDGFKDYLCFQFCLYGKTMFRDIQELRPAHHMRVQSGTMQEKRYWQVYYRLDWGHTQRWFEEKLRQRFDESVRYNVLSDVPIGGSVSGGIDSTIVSAMASGLRDDKYIGFTGKFSSLGKAYDESEYARAVADENGFELHQIDIVAQDFIDNIEKVIYHLDTPVAGPGSFPQYMVSQLASKHRKVVLGGQGGDEIFGGYTRYLVAYLEQCLKGAIEGTTGQGPYGPYIVTMESIIPNLTALKPYIPMLKGFFAKGLFEPQDARYFELVNRAPNIGACVHWDRLGDYSPFETYQRLFNARNVEVESYFDRMTHYDFKTLLPALLQVEDRMSMAHGIESRVPFLDHKLVELAATIPANMKFKDGRMKYILQHAMKQYIPQTILDRKDKMGFPTPFAAWAKNETHDFVFDILSTQKAKQRELVNNAEVLRQVETESSYGRNLWGMFCIELWQRAFHDQAAKYRAMLD